MRIAIPVEGSGTIKRGIERWAIDLAYALLKHNVDVTLFKGGGVAESKIERVIPCLKRNSAILGGKNSRISWSRRVYYEKTSFSISLLPHILFGDFDIWHISSLHFTLKHLKSRKIIRQKLVYTCHAPTIHSSPDWLDAITQPAPFYIENAQKANLDIKKWFLLPNFVDTERFSPKAKPIRNELGIPNDSFVVLSTGAIIKRYKRMNYLIEEFAKIPKKENAFLLIVGEEEDETPWIESLGRELLGNKVKFLSNIPDQMMPQIYASCDIFALASLDEYFGIVFLEAMASGKPVIGAAYPVTKWVIGEGGENINMSIDGSLATTLRKYINDASLREKRGRLARNRVEELFTLEKAAEKTIDLYKRVLEK